MFTLIVVLYFNRKSEGPMRQGLWKMVIFKTNIHHLSWVQVKNIQTVIGLQKYLPTHAWSICAHTNTHIHTQKAICISMISGTPCGIPRLPLLLTSATGMSLSQKPSVNFPPPSKADPDLDSVNLMMPLSDLRWTEGMSLFQPLSVLLQSVQAGCGPMPQCCCTMADHASPKNGHTCGGKEVSAHMLAFVHARTQMGQAQ